MAKYGSAQVGFLLVGGFSLLASDVFDLSGPVDEAVMDESTALGDGWTEHLPSGLRKLTLRQNGLFDDVAAGVNAAFTGNQQLERVVCITYTGNAIGNRFIGLKGAFGATVSRVAARGQLHRMNIEYVVTGPKDEGVILQRLAAQTVTGDTQSADSQDNGASTANGGAGYLQVTAYSGFTTVVVKVRHSVDDIVYADLITFATVTAAPVGERVTVAGTVNRHLAASWTVTGTGSITFMVGFARG